MGYNDIVGELDSSFLMYSHCGRPSAHPLSFIFPDRFLLKKIRYFSACFLISQVALYDDNILMYPYPSRFFQVHPWPPNNLHRQIDSVLFEIRNVEFFLMCNLNMFFYHPDTHILCNNH